MWNCESCKNQNEDSFNFCWSCGEPAGRKAETDPVNDRPIMQPISPMKRAETPIENPKQTRAVKKSAESEKVWREIQPEKKAAAEAAAQIESSVAETPVLIDESTPVRAEKLYDRSEPVSPAENRLVAPGSSSKHETELFATFRSDSETADTTSDSDWPRTIFIAAVRLVGLYLLLLVFFSLPELISLIYLALTAPVQEGLGLLNLIGKPLIVLAAKLLFYLLSGIYFIASGRLFIRLLPN